ncbi:LysR substrate-binding domain-containing protein [Rhodococcus opacus]|nr:LysR substrate-binding domain-containing protein [Rhodococcus opacus]
MELRHLRSFITLASTLHFGRAAAQLNISQPPLSQQIQKLERQLGMELFERNRRGVALTEAGESLIPLASRVLDRCDELIAVAGQIRDGRSGTLRIGHIGSSMLHALPEILEAFTTEHPGIHVSLTQMESSTQLKALRARTIQIGMCRLIDTPDGMRSMTIATERLVVAVPSGWKLSNVDSISIGALRGTAFVGPPRQVSPIPYWELVDRLCSAYGFRPEVAYESPNILNMAGFVQAGLGVALIPHSLAQLPLRGVTYFDVADQDAVLPLQMCWLDQTGFPALDYFVAIAGAHSSAGRRARRAAAPKQSTTRGGEK